MVKSAILVLEDGTCFYGESIGIDGFSVGEVVFNTSITGYQEIITDPSYFQQIITFTYPHIGNVGINNDDVESRKIHASGIIVRNLSKIPSNYRSIMSLPEYFKENKIVAISGIDTRKLTLLIRRKGIQLGCIMSLNKGNFLKAKQCISLFKNVKNVNLVGKITTKNEYSWKSFRHFEIEKKNFSYRKKKYFVVVYDFGVKHSILDILESKNCRLLIVPSYTTAERVLKLNPDGIFLSNGPGDPRLCNGIISVVKIFLKKNIPIFGICFGHQILALASNAKVVKMKHGHHGSNHPVKNILTSSVFITSQNHNFSVDYNSVRNNLEISHVSLFDRTVQGILRTDKKAFSFQGHPEANPGPHDVVHLFDDFINLMNNT